MNEILIRRKNSFILERLPELDSTPILNALSTYVKSLDTTTQKALFAATVANNMISLGFIPDKDMFNKMISDSVLALKVQTYIIPMLESKTGANVKYIPMYKNFPKEVLTKTNFELTMNALAHYNSDGAITISEDEREREKLNQIIKCTPVHITDEKAIDTLSLNLLKSATPLTGTDISDLEKIHKEKDITVYLPNSIPCKENIANIAKVLYKNNNIASLNHIRKYVKNPNEVLRILNTINGTGDASLTNISVNNMSRAMRRFALRLINECENPAEEMKLYKNNWIKVGEKLHPGEYAKQFPNAYNAFSSLRDKELLKEVKTFNAKIESALSDKVPENVKEKIFEENPGAFAKNIDRLLRNQTEEEQEKTIDTLKKLSGKMSSNILWQLHAHFSMRNQSKTFHDESVRTFKLKNSKGKNVVISNELKEINEGTCQKVVSVVEEALKEKYKKKSPMGKVYISDNIKECKIPNDTRNTSKEASLAKGSKINFKNSSNIRGFIWWTNRKDNFRTDIDLSAAFLDEKFKQIGSCSYRNLRNAYAVHSGDIVDGKDFNSEGVAEFLDINVKDALASGVRYCIFSVHNYTNFNFSELEHAHFGYMERDELNNGEIFEPSTVKNKIKLSAEAVSAIPCMFDLKEHKMIWIDTPFSSVSKINNVETNIVPIEISAFNAANTEKASISDLVRVNVEARGGVLVDSPEEAEIVFDLDGEEYNGKTVITPFDLDYFSGNLLPETEATQFNKSKEKDNSDHEDIEI